MSWSNLGIVGLIGLILLVIVVEIFIVWTVAGYFASLLGATGMIWWCVTIVIFCVINALVGALGKIGQ